MKKCLLIILSCITLCQLQAADYYWVGGTGNWSDLNHWRLGSSTGPIPSIVPSSADNVFFDANSGFTAASKIVTLNANGFCNNMTWGNVANSPTFITTSAAFKVQVSGNLSLSPTTTYQVIIVFTGATPATLTSNGTVTGQFGIEIDKPGSSLTVTDSLIVPSAVTTAGTNGLTFTAGTFDITGKKMKVYQFLSSNDNVRVLQMANADLNITSSPGNSTFVYTGLGKTLNAAGSTVYTGGFRADGGSYNKVTATNASGPTLIMISNTAFNSLTFSPAAGTIYSDITNGNTVDTLIYNGYGSIGSNNTIGRVYFNQTGSMDGTGNVIGSITCLNNFAVSANYTNTVDSLVLAANQITQFRGTFNINKYLYVAGTACEAYTEINGDSLTGTVNFAAGAIVDISNVILTGVKATGPVTPIAVNGIDGTGNAGFTITETSVAGTTLYWVGGAGDWNDRAHWSTASGGAGGACIPFTGDNVVFDANSGLASGTVTTTSSSFCKNMTWAGVGTVTFNESGTSQFKIYGSLVMDPSVTMNALPDLAGSDPASITTNGSTLGGLQFYIKKTGGGVVTLTDDWNNSTGGSFVHVSGGLNLSGRIVNLVYYTSVINSTRSVDISNATLSFASYWDYRGTGKTLNAMGSHIITNGGFGTDGLSYPWVDITGTSGTGIGFPISTTTFGQLTYTNNSAISGASIGSNNTVRRLEFKGKGAMGAGNSIDSLILTGPRNYSFSGTNTINKYLMAQSATCGGLLEMRGIGTLAFASGVEIHLNNIYMQNMTATGPVTPISFNGADAGGNSGWTIISAAGSPRYWIGGAGDWNDAAHWSSTSGGAGGACIPTVYDDVYFNAGSGFTAASKTVTVNNGNAYCRNINWTGATNSPTWNKSASWGIECWGDSIIVNPATTLNVSFLTLKGSNATFLKGSAPSGKFDLYIDKPGGSLTILNDYSNILSDIQLINGAFNAPGRTLTVKTIDNLGSANASSIDISNANLTVVTGWRYSGATAAHALNAAGSTITSSGVTTNGFTYNKISLYGTTAISGSMNSSTIDSLIFTDPSTTSLIGISGINNTLNYVEYKGSGGIYATGNTIDTLVFFPGSTYTLTAGTNTTITGEWYGSGTPCRPTEIVSSSTSANATITKTSGTAEFDYIRLRRITAAGAAAPFIAQEHSTDMGNNVNWNIEPYNGAAPMEGLGSDTAITIDQFPYTLTTDGFFGSPSSQYLWNDNSTLDSLVITGYGTYTVSVSFADGCSVSDQVTVSHLASLPVTLVNFNAKVQDCQSLVSWEVTDAVNFSHFVIEQSKDGSQFASIGEVLYTPGVDKYSYIDNTPGNGKIYYRLKCVDVDGKYRYSPVVSVSLNCNDKLIQVYPTVTSNTVKVVMPPGYEKVRLYLMNSSGQRIDPVVNGTGTVRTLSLHNLPAATYFLQVVNGSETRSFRIVKQ